MNVLDVELAAREAFTLGRALFAIQPVAAEDIMLGREAALAQAAAKTDVRGKYQRCLHGYIFVSPTFDGRFYRELPEGTSHEDVIALEVQHGQTPLLDRLMNLGMVVREQATTDRGCHLVEAIERMVRATDAEHSQQIFFGIKQRGGQLILNGDLTEAKYQEFLESLTELAEGLRAAPAADGFTIASLLIMRNLGIAMAAKSADNPQMRVSLLAHAVGFLVAPSPSPIKAVAHGYAAGRIINGDGVVVREVAEELKSQGDDLIKSARNVPLDDSFFVLLYQAAAYETAAWLLSNAGAEVDPDPVKCKHWRKMAMNAEERMVRIQVSLVNAVANLDGTAGGEHRHLVRIERQTKGDAAAKKLAEEFVDNLLYYPRAGLPILLDLQPPTPTH
jgi:hypothetical protein